MVRLTKGSNQYRTRVAAEAGGVPEYDLVQQARADGKLRCGQVWGTRCQVWVAPPEYTHDQHGLNSRLDREVTNQACSATGLALIATRDSRRHVLVEIIKHPNCQAAMLRHLAQAKDAGTHFWIAQRRDCPADVLSNFAEHQNLNVRWAAAKHHSTPQSVLIQLAGDPAVFVRRAALENTNLPQEYKMLLQLVR